MRDDVDKLELVDRDLEDPSLLADLEALKQEAGETSSSPPATQPPVQSQPKPPSSSSSMKVTPVAPSTASDISSSISPPATTMSSFPTLSANRKAGFFEDFIVEQPRAERPVAPTPKKPAPAPVVSSTARNTDDEEALSPEEERELRILQGETGHVESAASEPADDGMATAKEIEERMLQWKRRWRDCKAANAPAAEVTAALRNIKKLQALTGQSSVTRSALPPAPPAPQTPPQPSVSPAPPARVNSPTPAKPAAVPKAAPKQSRAPAPSSAAVTTKPPAKTAKRSAAPSSPAPPTAHDAADSEEAEGLVEELVGAPMKRSELVDKLRAQIESLHDRALALKNSGDKQAALQMYRLQKDAMAHYQAFVSLLTNVPEGAGLEAEGCLLHQTRYITVEHSNPRLDEDELEISITSAASLPLPSGYTTLSTYAVLMFPFPSETQPIRIATPIVANTRSPEWKHVARVRMERKKFSKWVQRRVLTVDILHSRWLFSDVLIGRAEVKLAPLLNSATHTESVHVLDGRRVTGGQLTISLAVRVPLQGRHIQRDPVTFLLPHLPSMPSLLRLKELQEQKAKTPQPTEKPRPPTVAGAPSSAPAAPAESSRPTSPPVPSPSPTPVDKSPSPAPTPTSPSPAPVVQKPPPAAAEKPAPVAATAPSPSLAPATEPKASAKQPAAKAPAKAAAAAPVASDDDLEDQANNVDSIVSNNVLEWEIENAKKEAEAFRVKKSPVPEALEDRLQHLELKMQLLIISVQTGQLTMEAYMAQLNAKIAADRQLAAKLTKAGKKEVAKRVLMRVKIMQNEATESAGGDGAET